MASKWRGDQSSPLPEWFIVKGFVEAGANLMRVQIVESDTPSTTPEEWKTRVRYTLDRLDSQVLPKLTKCKVVIDIHHPPGGFVGKKYAMLSTKPELVQPFLEMWEEIALRYKDNDKILVYGVLNEPAGGAAKVNKLMKDAVDVIRAIDPDKRIAVSNPYSDPTRFDEMIPIFGKGPLWYEAHMYLPLPFTHQGIYDYPSPKFYPTATLNKDKLIQYLAKIREFQLTHKARIFIGEFSVSNLAPMDSRISYLEDVISIFEKRRWSWCYQAWRGGVWDPELPTPEPADLLESYWEKNV